MKHIVIVGIFFFNSKEENKQKLIYVNIILNIVSSLKSKPPKTYNKPVGRFLPYTKEGDVVKVPLHMHEILEALVCNDWTKKKNGDKNNLIASPIKIEWSYNDEKYSFDFDSSSNQTPGLLCEPLIQDMGKEAKEEIIICLSEKKDIPHNLFDFS